MATVYIQHR